MVERGAGMTGSAWSARSAPFGQQTADAQPREEVSRDYVEGLDRVRAETEFLNLAGGKADQGAVASSLRSESRTRGFVAWWFAPPRDQGNPLLHWLLDLKRLFGSTSPGTIIETTEHWEGAVLEIQDGTFIAQLVDIRGERPDEEAEFSLREVSDDQRHLVELGAVFMWKADLVKETSGRVWRRSVVQFSAVKKPTKADRSRGKMLAQEVRANFDDA
jgi:hypothetical protein